MANSENKPSLALADEVWHRVVQIVQEALLTGVDCSDLLRQVRVEESVDNQLVLTAAYKQQVEEGYRKMVADAEVLAEQRRAAKIVGST